MFFLQMLITTYYYHLATSTFYHTESVCFCSCLEGNCMASGPATRDVHLFNSIMGGISSAIAACTARAEANPQWACSRALRERDSANPSLRHRHSLVLQH